MAADPDADLLEEAAATVAAIDRRYRRASFEEKIALKDQRDAAFTAYALARNKLLEEGVIVSDADVEEMRSIAAEVKKAADTASLIRAIGKVVLALSRVALPLPS